MRTKGPTANLCAIAKTRPAPKRRPERRSQPQRPNALGEVKRAARRQTAAERFSSTPKLTRTARMEFTTTIPRDESCRVERQVGGMVAMVTLFEYALRRLRALPLQWQTPVASQRRAPFVGSSDVWHRNWGPEGVAVCLLVPLTQPKCRFPTVPSRSNRTRRFRVFRLDSRLRLRAVMRVAKKGEVAGRNDWNLPPNDWILSLLSPRHGRTLPEER
jgi:hypothetical protein